MSKQIECKHFWKIVLPVTDIESQLHECMLCGKQEKREMIILELEEKLNG